MFAAAAALAGVALVATLRRGDLPARGGALAAIPADAMLVVTADLDRLRASPVLAPLVREGRELPGIGKLSDACGFDPVARLREIAIAVPAGGDDGEVGVAAVGAVEAAPLAACASKIVASRGGRPVVETVGSFTIVRDARADHGGEIAVRDGGPVLLGGGAYLRQMMRAAERTEPTVASGAHGRLRETIGPGAIVATMLVPKSMKDRARAELGGRDVPAMRVESVVASLAADPDVRVHAIATCDDAAPCAELSKSLASSRDEHAKDLGARLVGLGALLDRVVIETRGASIDARVRLGSDEATGLLDRLFTLNALRAATPTASSDALPEVAAPDEVVRPASSSTEPPRRRGANKK